MVFLVLIMLQIALSLFLFMKVNFLNFVAKLGNFLFVSIWRMWAMSAMPLALGVLASATQTTFLPSGHFQILSSTRSTLQKENIVTYAILLLDVVSRRTMVRGQRVEITKPTSPLLIFEHPSPPSATTSTTRFVFNRGFPSGI